MKVVIMFGHTQFSIGPQFPSHAVNGRKGAPTPKPQSASIPQQVARRPSSSPLVDRFSNKSYESAASPSPVTRFPSRPTSPASVSSARDVPLPKPIGIRSRSLAPSDKSPRLTVGTKSEVGPRQSSPASARMGPLREQCKLQPRPRPRTAGTHRDDDIDSRLMVAVKQALSQVVLERGPIYEHNIDTVMYDMKNRLRLADEKPSDTTVDSRKTSPLAGIVRKDLGDLLTLKQSGYKPVYGGGLRKSPSNRVIDKDPNTVVFIDLPDPDSSNFNFLLNKERSQSTIRQKSYDFVDANKYSNVASTPTNIDLERESEEEMSSYVEERVGDGQPRSSRSFTIWKDSDDTKLQKYISKLIDNMNNKLQGDLPNEGVEREADETDVCTSVCVCKVCRNNKQQQPKKELNKPICMKPKPIYNGLKSSIGQTSSILSNIGKSQLTSKVSKASTNLRVQKKAENLVIDSKSTINPRGTSFSAPPPPYTTQTPEPEDEEALEEMYLRRRRMRLAPGKRD